MSEMELKESKPLLGHKKNKEGEYEQHHEKTCRWGFK